MARCTVLQSSAVLGAQKESPAVKKSMHFAHGDIVVICHGIEAKEIPKLITLIISLFD